MPEKASNGDYEYIRVALVTSEHPGRPLDGTVLAFTTAHDIDVPEDAFDQLLKQAHERFDIDSYATDLRVATLYITEETGKVTGVKWENSPAPYEHGKFSEVISELPDSMESVFESQE